MALGPLSTETHRMRQIVCPDIVGREEEIAVLAAGLAASRAGQGQAIVLAGEAGVGKTRLTREAEARARQEGIVALRARAVEMRPE